MAQLTEDYDAFKVSAFSKLKLVSPYVHKTTIGPNRDRLTKQEDSIQSEVKNVKKATSRATLRPPNQSQLVLNYLLRQFENERQVKLQEEVDKHCSQITQFSRQLSANTNQNIAAKQHKLLEQVQQQELAILEALEQHDKDASAHNQQLLKYYEELAEKHKQHNREIVELERRKQQINSIIDKIKKEQVEFRTVYQEVIASIRSCKDHIRLKESLGDASKQLKTLPESMDEIIGRCKGGKISTAESQKASELVQRLNSVLAKVREAVKAINEAKEKEKTPAAIAVQPPQQSQSKLTEEPAKPLDTKLTKISFISRSSLLTYSELQDFYERHSKLYEEVEKNDALKQFRFDCKKAVNIPVNAISAINAHHLLDKYNRLIGLLQGRTVEVGNVSVCAAKHPQGVAFCTNLLAKKFVLQGDLMISSNPEAAYCYAAVIVAIWHDNADFGRLIRAHFYKQCPYLVPMYPPKVVGQSDQEYYTSLGYQYTDDKIEKQDHFVKRMTGIMRLYSAIIITRPKRGQQSNPYGITEGWRWLAAFLNLEPQPDITATMLHVFLESAGSSLQSIYGKAFAKLMNYVCNIYLPILQKIDSGGPVTRLEVLLQNYSKSGIFEAPHGMFNNSFW